MKDRSKDQMLAAVTELLSTGKISAEDTCKLLNTVARFEERTDDRSNPKK